MEFVRRISADSAHCFFSGHCLMEESCLDFLPLHVVSVGADGKRRFDGHDKQKLIDACLRSRASVASMALKAEVNANQLWRWIKAYQAKKKGNCVVGLAEARGQRTTADGLSLRYHVALGAMRMGQGYPGAVHTLTAVIMLARTLAHAGHGMLSAATRSAGERAVSVAFNVGSERGEWWFDDDGYQAMAAIVNLHDFQFYTAPLSAIAVAAKWLDGLPSGALFRPPGTTSA